LSIDIFGNFRLFIDLSIPLSMVEDLRVIMYTGDMLQEIKDASKVVEDCYFEGWSFKDCIEYGRESLLHDAYHIQEGIVDGIEAKQIILVCVASGLTLEHSYNVARAYQNRKGT